MRSDGSPALSAAAFSAEAAAERERSSLTMVPLARGALPLLVTPIVASAGTPELTGNPESVESRGDAAVGPDSSITERPGAGAGWIITSATAAVEALWSIASAITASRPRPLATGAAASVTRWVSTPAATGSACVQVTVPVPPGQYQPWTVLGIMLTPSGSVKVSTSPEAISTSFACVTSYSAVPPAVIVLEARGLTSTLSDALPSGAVGAAAAESWTSPGDPVGAVAGPDVRIGVTPAGGVDDEDAVAR